MTCLTVTDESVTESIDRQASLIVTHHPILFRSVQRLSADTPEGRLLWKLARAGVSVYSPHTAFDNAAQGINARLAERLGLREVRALRSRTAAAGACKLVVFVPEQDLIAVSNALFAAGAGRIGEYRECSFRQEGIGTFFGTEATNPSVGQKGRREEVREFRLEVIVPQHRVADVVAAMRSAHSYEEPAYDIYPLLPSGGEEGEGRIGVLPTPTSLADFSADVRKQLGCKLVQYCGSANRAVQRVAVACGAAAEFLKDAAQAHAEVFVTGEARFHDCLAARSLGIELVLAGHFASERFAVEELAAMLKRTFEELEIWASERESDPLIVA
jgi:dinuclear metal center YbgI/SA1388 family protein